MSKCFHLLWVDRGKEKCSTDRKRRILRLFSFLSASHWNKRDEITFSFSVCLISLDFLLHCLSWFIGKIINERTARDRRLTSNLMMMRVIMPTNEAGGKGRERKDTVRYFFISQHFLLPTPLQDAHFFLPMINSRYLSRLNVYSCQKRIRFLNRGIMSLCCCCYNNIVQLQNCTFNQYEKVDDNTFSSLSSTK